MLGVFKAKPEGVYMFAIYMGVWCLFQGKFREPWLNLGAADCCLFVAVAMHILTSSAAYNLSFINVSICVLLYERKTFQKPTLQQSHMNVITVSIHPKESLFQHLQNFCKAHEIKSGVLFNMKEFRSLLMQW